MNFTYSTQQLVPVIGMLLDIPVDTQKQIMDAL
jgi:hypothetical protein